MVLYDYLINRWCRPPEEPAGKRRANAGRDADSISDWKEGFILGRQEGFADGRQEGFADGRQETNRKWAKWLDRKADAENRGLPFTEPPPNATR